MRQPRFSSVLSRAPFPFGPALTSNERGGMRRNVLLGVLDDAGVDGVRRKDGGAEKGEVDQSGLHRAELKKPSGKLRRRRSRS